MYMNIKLRKWVIIFIYISIFFIVFFDIVERLKIEGVDFICILLIFFLC